MMKYSLYAKNLINNKIKIALLFNDIKIQVWQSSTLDFLDMYHFLFDENGIALDAKNFLDKKELTIVFN